jgi:valyl-tRNA synthetase
MASPGTDIAFSEARTEGYRAFANKIWNAARFLFMNIDRAKEAGIPFDPTLNVVILSGAPERAEGESNGTESKDPEDADTNEIARPFSTSNVRPALSDNTPIETRWILTRLSETCTAVDKSLTDYRFDEAANLIYQFFWGDLCDWYLELIKLRLNFDTTPEAVILSEAPERAGGESNGAKSKDPEEASPTQSAKELSALDKKQATTEALKNLTAIFEASLRLLSPFMPFITEEIWHALYNGAPPAKSIALTRYPQAADFPADPIAASAMKTLQDLITTIRALRKELGVPEKEPTPITIHASNRINAIADANTNMLARMARVASVEFASEPLSGSNARSTADFDVAITYERQIDVPAERERLTKELAKYEKGLAAAERQLSNEAFTAKAPAHIIEGLRKQSTETKILYDKTKAALDALG